MDDELQKAFVGPGGSTLLAWLIQKGHIHQPIDENPASLVEHNLVKSLLLDAGYEIMPEFPKKKSVEKSENVIDQINEEKEQTNG